MYQSVSTTSKPLRLTSFGLIGLPLAVVSIVFALIAMVAIASDQITLVSPAALLIAGALVYSATIFILTRTGVTNVRHLETLGETDKLSLLPNRRALHADVTQLAKDHDEVAIALVDLDSFKQINDHFGHAIGDRLIAACAAKLRTACGDEATCYHLNGDEFAAVMAGPVAGTIIEGICRGLLEELANPIEINGHRIHVGASVGLSRSTPRDPRSSSELLRRSDVAMFMSKRGGKMRCTWFSETFDQQREVVRETEEDLRDALANREFSIAYQPLVDAVSGRIVAVEALMRWNRNGEAVSPAVFIPIAEETGLINPIGLWVLEQAMNDAAAWNGITLSVNISAAQLRNPEFAIKLGELLEKTGFAPHMLELEITETCLVLDPIVAERSLDVIRGFGVNISLDDFGTGYASIGFLRQFRFEKLKLDRSLVTQAGQDNGSRAMMISSIAMARALDMRVTAEGVETKEQADMVRLAGADQIQGWLYYKALPAREVGELCARQLSETTQDLVPDTGGQNTASQNTGNQKEQAA